MAAQLKRRRLRTQRLALLAMHAATPTATTAVERRKSVAEELTNPTVHTAASFFMERALKRRLQKKDPAREQAGQSNNSEAGQSTTLVGQSSSEAGQSTALSGQSNSDAGLIGQYTMNTGQSKEYSSQSSPPTNGKATRLERQCAVADARGSNGAVSEIGRGDIIIDVRPSRMEHKKSTESEV